MRKLSFYSKKKLRGLRRRLLDISRWADSFIGNFPKISEFRDNYWEEKIPIESNLLEGTKSRKTIKRECIASLIRACSNLIQSKPDYAHDYRVICLIVMPYMFPSRVCIWRDRECFMESVSGCDVDNVEFKKNTTSSLLGEYAVLAPAGMHEVGYDITEKENGVAIRRVTYWFVGEVE